MCVLCWYLKDVYTMMHGQKNTKLELCFTVPNAVCM